MRSTVLLIACALPLAACNKPEVRETNASVADVAKAVRESGSDTFVRPGKWESKVSITEFDVPGMPPEMAQQMKQSMAQFQERNFETCLTKEDVKQPKEDFFTGSKNNQCRYDHFTMGGGKIDAVMRCEENGASQIMRMAGNYSPDSYDMRMAMEREGGEKAMGAMTMKMRVESHRIGECTSDELKVASGGGKK